jgi:hypothetical protein
MEHEHEPPKRKRRRRGGAVHGGAAKERPDRRARGGAPKRRASGGDTDDSNTDYADDMNAKFGVPVSSPDKATQDRVQLGNVKLGIREQVNRKLGPDPGSQYYPDPNPLNEVARKAANISAPKRDQVDRAGERRGGPVPRARGGKLTAGERQGLPRSDFALPGKGAGPKGAGSGSYPIPDASHARNALARVSQHGSSAQKVEVRAKVHSKFPGIGKS